MKRRSRCFNNWIRRGPFDREPRPRPLKNASSADARGADRLEFRRFADITSERSFFVAPFAIHDGLRREREDLRAARDAPPRGPVPHLAVVRRRGSVFAVQKARSRCLGAMPARRSE